MARNRSSRPQQREALSLGTRWVRAPPPAASILHPATRAPLSQPGAVAPAQVPSPGARRPAHPSKPAVLSLTTPRP